MADEFLTMATEKMAELRAEDDHLEGMARGIAQKRATLAEAIQKLAEAVELYTEMMGKARTALAPASQRQFGDLAGMTIPDACEVVMRAKGGRVRVTELRDILAGAGKLKGKPGNRYNTLVATMERFPKRFRRVGSGEWELILVDSATTAVQPPGVPPGGWSRQNLALPTPSLVNGQGGVGAAIRGDRL